MKPLFLIPVFFLATLDFLRAAEAGGMIVEVQKSALSSQYGSDPRWREVNRTMTLKISVKNNTMKPMEEGKLQYTIIIKRRWTSELGDLERKTGSMKLEALPPNRSVVLEAGNINLSGYYQGTSNQYVDKIVAWKVTITRGDKNWDFLSSTNFDSYNARVRR